MAPLHNHRQPFSAERVIGFLDKLSSPLPAALLTIVLLRRFKHVERHSARLVDIKQRYPLLMTYLAFVALKTVHRAINRLALNNGWQRIKPRWSEEIVVITGGSAGIGKEVYEMLLRAFPGVRVAVLDISDPKDRPRTADVRFWKVNIADEAQVHKAAEEIRADFGEPTMIVNNAGIIRSKDLVDLTAKEFEMTLRINVGGAFIVTKEFLPAMVRRGRGHIVTVSSTAAFVSPPSMADYSASKAGVLAFHEVLTAELRARYHAPHIRTTLIAPVKVATALGTMVDDLASKILVPTLEPWQVAEKIVRALDSGLSGGTVFCPSFLWVTLPLLRAGPPWYSWYVDKSQNLSNFGNPAARKRGTSGGYRIVADES